MPLQSKGGFKNKSQLVKVEEKKDDKVELKASDTDFLLKLFMDSSFKGSDIEKAHAVLTKLATMHRRNLNV